MIWNKYIFLVNKEFIYKNVGGLLANIRIDHAPYKKRLNNLLCNEWYPLRSATSQLSPKVKPNSRKCFRYLEHRAHRQFQFQWKDFKTERELSNALRIYLKFW